MDLKKIDIYLFSDIIHGIFSVDRKVFIAVYMVPFLIRRRCVLKNHENTLKAPSALPRKHQKEDRVDL